MRAAEQRVRGSGGKILTWGLLDDDVRGGGLQNREAEFLLAELKREFEEIKQCLVQDAPLYSAAADRVPPPPQQQRSPATTALWAGPSPPMLEPLRGRRQQRPAYIDSSAAAAVAALGRAARRESRGATGAAGCEEAEGIALAPRGTPCDSCTPSHRAEYLHPTHHSWSNALRWSMPSDRRTRVPQDHPGALAAALDRTMASGAPLPLPVGGRGIRIAKRCALLTHARFLPRAHFS